MSDKITMRPVEALIPYARKAATHSKAQVAQIAGSIREFGFTNPVPDDGENEIIAGHGRRVGGAQVRHGRGAMHRARASHADKRRA
jgi:hypothetical protein